MQRLQHRDRGRLHHAPSMLKMRLPNVPAMVESAASSDTLKKYFSLGTLAMDLISSIRLSVLMLFLV